MPNIFDTHGIEEDPLDVDAIEWEEPVMEDDYVLRMKGERQLGDLRKEEGFTTTEAHLGKRRS